ADIDKLHVLDGLNVRIKDEALTAHIRSLADKMKAEGFKPSKPLEVVVLEEGGKTRLVVTDGHCRLAAVKIAIAEGAEIMQIPCVALPSKGTTLQDLVAGLVTSNSGKPLTTYETALVCKRLYGYGWKEPQIAERLSFGEAYVSMLLELVAAPLSIISMVQSGEVAPTFAVEMMRKHRDKAVEVLKQGLTAAKTAGKTRVTNAYLPGAALKKLVKRQADSLYETAKSITQDPGYSNLTDKTRTKLDQLLADIAEREKALDEKLKKAAEDSEQDQQEETQA
ncbi:ParB/RepB/Spo0J family partition protein, partial [Pseudomonas aeruginosa]|uniref:ParB/RepB/Spo0J family partition protein n=1 Tax=Pseudomonas aeruginosa TaxID=287 RepID=UPI00287D6D25